MCRRKEPAFDKAEIAYAIDKHKRRDAVVSVKDFKLPSSYEADYWLRDIPVFLNKGCTCPNPMLSVLEICEHCRWLLLISGLHNLVKHNPRYPCNVDAIKGEIEEFPSTIEPSA